LTFIVISLFHIKIIFPSRIYAPKTDGQPSKISPSFRMSTVDDSQEKTR